MAAPPGDLQLRLLLDEHYTPVIAQQLRERGHDVVSVLERDDLRSASDVELFAAAREERRALLTNNVIDFMPLVHQAAQEGTSHFGVLFTSDRSLPRTLATVGDYVRVLDELLTANRAEDALLDEVRWLP